MANETFELVEHKEVTGSAVAAIEFSNIPQDADDLVILCSLRGTFNDVIGSGLIRFNGSSANFTNRTLLGAVNNIFTSDYTTTRQINSINGATSTANTFSTHRIYISGYRSNVAKSFSVEGGTEENGGYNELGIMSNLWNNTNPITSISLVSNGNIAVGSSATLYKIKKFAPVAPKATGGSISYVNGYYIHTFTASGTFTPTQDISNVEYLVIAGGGGGGGFDGNYGYGGGGGAGGYRSSVVGEPSGASSSAEARLNLTSGIGYTVTVGAGGGSATNGNSSAFGSITTTGGGYGGGGNSSTGYAANGGGSGGGAGRTFDVARNTGGTGTTNQGTAGASRTNGDGKGGGGAGVAATANSANGGAGLTSSIAGYPLARGGGGGGGQNITPGAGGTGGGGRGGYNVTVPTAYPENGVANTGGGGGGAYDPDGPESPGGANGGSGVVIVRYAG